MSRWYRATGAANYNKTVSKDGIQYLATLYQNYEELNYYLDVWAAREEKPILWANIPIEKARTVASKILRKSGYE